MVNCSEHTCGFLLVSKSKAPRGANNTSQSALLRDSLPILDRNDPGASQKIGGMNRSDGSETCRHAMLFLMIRTVAVEGYRSLRDLSLPLGQLSLITGANGSGKSSVYRSLRLLADAGLNSVVASLAREGGLPSTFWAGPETISRGVRQKTYAVEGLANRKVASLKLGSAAIRTATVSTWAILQHLHPPRCLNLIHTSSANASGMGLCIGRLLLL